MNYTEFAGRTDWAPARPLHGYLARRQYELLCRFKQPAAGTRFVEVGAGSGNLARLLLGIRGLQYIAVEPEPTLAQNLRDGLGCDVVEEALPDIDAIPDGYADVVFTTHVIEHAKDSIQALAWLKEMSRMTKPGGVVVTIAPDLRDFKASFWDLDWTHGFPTTPRRLQQLHTEAGMRVIVAKSMHLGRLGGTSSILAYLMTLITPTRLLDAATNRWLGRPLASGFQSAFVWGNCFVVSSKTSKGS